MSIRESFTIRYAYSIRKTPFKYLFMLVEHANFGGDPVNTPPNCRFRTRDQNIARFTV